MKKILFITVLQVLLIGGSVKAEVVQIPIHTASLTDNRERGPIRHSPTKVKVPIVTLDDNTITVQTNHYGQELYLKLEDGDIARSCIYHAHHKWRYLCWRNVIDYILT